MAGIMMKCLSSLCHHIFQENLANSCRHQWSFIICVGQDGIHLISDCTLHIILTCYIQDKCPLLIHVQKVAGIFGCHTVEFDLSLDLGLYLQNCRNYNWHWDMSTGMWDEDEKGKQMMGNKDMENVAHWKWRGTSKKWRGSLHMALC